MRASRTRDAEWCHHGVNLGSSIARSFNHDVVCRLWGFHGARMTSLPGIVAYSTTGTRIAIADWDKILIWGLNGEVLMDGEAGSRYYDMVWDPRFCHDHVVLKPILLKAGSVVRQMAFGRHDNELVALTSSRLQIWELGASGTGRRVVHDLDERAHERESTAWSWLGRDISHPQGLAAGGAPLRPLGHGSNAARRLDSYRRRGWVGSSSRPMGAELRD
jgi:hypothetical protein